MPDNEIGANLKIARERTGLSVADVVAATGLSRQSVYEWERGEYKPSFENLEKLAELYKTTPAALRYGIEGAYGDSEAFQAGVQEGLRRAMEALSALQAAGTAHQTEERGTRRLLRPVPRQRPGRGKGAA